LLDSVPQSFVRSFIHSFIHSVSLVEQLWDQNCFLTLRLIDSIPHSFIHSFIHSFACPAYTTLRRKQRLEDMAGTDKLYGALKDLQRTAAFIEKSGLTI
jgi:hypothetical protein